MADDLKSDRVTWDDVRKCASGSRGRRALPWVRPVLVTAGLLVAIGALWALWRLPLGAPVEESTVTNALEPKMRPAIKVSSSARGEPNALCAYLLRWTGASSVNLGPVASAKCRLDRKFHVGAFTR